MKKVLITGATGKIGSQLISRLVRNNDIMVRAFVRNAEKAVPLQVKRVELVYGSFENARTVREAVEDIDTLVLITTQNPDAAYQASAMIKAARNSGIRKIVRISVFKAAVDGPTAITRLHGQTDIEIQDSGLTHIILRPPFFMQNLFFMAAHQIHSEDKLYFGTGEGKLGLIDLRDIADCAAQCVVTNTYDNKTFTLTGPESLNFHEIANQLSNILGRRIQYVDLLPEAVENSIRSLGWGDWYAQVIGDFCKAYRENWGYIITDDVAFITGYAARSFDQFAREQFVPSLMERN